MSRLRTVARFRTAGHAALLAVVVSTTGCSLALDRAAEVPPAPREVVRGGTLRVGIPTPASIDPAQAYDRAGQLVVEAMCNPLIEMHPDTGVPYAGLTKHIVQEPDGTAVTVTLKDDLRFSDGTPAVVSDVRASLSRVASDTLASPLAEEAKVIAGFPQVHGDVPVEGEDDPARSSLLGAVQVTKQVVTIVGTSADAELPAYLARGWTAIVPEARGDRIDFDRNPVCVGPYRLEKTWRPGDETITLTRSAGSVPVNEAYTDGGRGYPDRITFHIYKDEPAAFDAWLRGEVDVAPVPRERLGTPTPGGRVTTGPAPVVEYVGLPVNVAPFKNSAVRRALSVALDRQALIGELDRPDRIPARSFLPATMPGGFASRASCRNLAPERGDVDRARSLLARAGVSLSGVRVPFYVNDDPDSGNRQLIEAIAEQWRNAFGIVPAVQPMTWAGYEQRARTPDGFDGAFRTSWTSPVAAPGAWLQPLALSASIPQTNLTRFTAVDIDRRYQRDVLEQNDHAVRAAAELAATDLVCSEMPLVPVWEATRSYVVRDNVKSAISVFHRTTTGELAIRELYVTR